MPQQDRFDQGPGKEFFLGIDVHKKQWVVSIRSCGMHLRTMGVAPSATALREQLHQQYGAGVYYSVYEAGFSGFSTHRDLQNCGIANIVVHAADVPSTGKQRQSKTDKTDSGKLALALERGMLQGVYIPQQQAEDLRTLVRVRQSFVKDQTRLKNRIRSLLHCHGLDSHLPQQNNGYWSKRLLQQISQLQQRLSPATAIALDLLLQEFLSVRQRILQCLRALREYLRQHSAIAATVKLLQSVPGVGLLVALTLYSELMQMQRFSSTDQLRSFVGLVPRLHSSGEREHVGGLTHRCKKQLRALLMEAAWVAVRIDPVLLETYRKLRARMKPQTAIIRIAAKLLNRIRHVWQHQQPYRTSVA